MNITIEGLSELQRELADSIWACDSQEDVGDFINSLSKRLRGQARFVHELMILAVVDNLVDNSTEYPQAQELLENISKNG